MSSPSTTIRLNSWDQLVLILPDRSGAEVEILLSPGNEGQVLRQLLKAQAEGKGKEKVGRFAGPTWKEMLEQGLLDSQIQKIAPTSRELRLTSLETKQTAEDLGL